MKNTSTTTIFLLFALANFVSAQRVSFSDCFPLAIGNKWNYTYVTKQIGYLTHFATTESGLIEYQVISKSEQSNGYVSWEIKQRKNATKDTYGIPLQSVKDSTTITIIESSSLNHELTSSSSSDPLSLFPFKTDSPDTSKFFRYKENLSDKDIFLRIIFPSPYDPSLSRRKYEFKLRENVGILMLVFEHRYVSGMESSEYYLTKYNNQTITSLEPIETINTIFSLSQNYPNPFNPETTIEYSIPQNVKGEMSKVTLKVYDLLGREVATLVDEFKQAGIYNSKFLASRDAIRSGSIVNYKLSSGVYFYRLQAGSFSETKKLILMK